LVVHRPWPGEETLRRSKLIAAQTSKREREGKKVPVKKTRPQLVTTAAVDMSSKMENHVPEYTRRFIRFIGPHI
jgi:hypothetical protein